MKNLIFTIATVLLTFTNGFAENAESKGENKKGNSEIVYYTTEDSTVIRPQSIVASGNEKTQEELIAEDNRITESTIEPAAPLHPGKSFEGMVADDNLVIESVVSKEVYPLDFKKINQKQSALKIRNKRLVGSL